MRHLGRLVLIASASVAFGALLVAPVSASPGLSEAPDAAYTHRFVAVPSLSSVLAVEETQLVGGSATIWRYDLRSHHWVRFARLPDDAGVLDLLAVLPGQARVYAIPQSPGGVGVLDLTTREYRTKPVPRDRPVGITDIAVDSRRGRILAWSDWDARLWSYSPAANVWTRVARGRPWPHVGLPGGGGGYSLMAFDTRADRLVLAVMPVAGRRGSTWLFDPERMRWARAQGVPPEINYGFGELLTNAVYDAAHRRTVLFSYGDVATYDSARDVWDTPSTQSWPDPFVRLDHQLVADAESGRIIVYGGSSLVDLPHNLPPNDFAWRADASVWAYDVGFNTWTRLTGS